MSRCVNITPKRKRICIGALRETIEVHSRSIKSPAFNTQENRQVYAPKITLKAAVETVTGIDIFDSVEVSGADGVPQTATVLFYTRYRDDITAEDRIKHDGLVYKIIKVENIDLNNRFLKIFTATTGDENKLAAL